MQSIDHDEQMEGMCDKCREEVSSSTFCGRCGKKITDRNAFINPNFDPERYARLNEEGR